MTKDEALKMAVKVLQNNKRTHYYCEDTWYSCPKHEDGCANDYAGENCDCGADKTNQEFDIAIQACKEALEQPSVAELNNEYLRDTHVEGLQPAQEPVAWQIFHSGVGDRDCEFTTINPASLDEQPSAHNSLRYTRPLYTHPAPLWQGNKEFVGLSEEEMMKLANKYIDLLPNGEIFHFDLFAHAIEQELKTKNGFSGLKDKNT